MTFCNWPCALCLAGERQHHSVCSEDICGTQWAWALDGVYFSASPAHCDSALILAPLPFHEYVCNRVRSSLYFSLWAQSKRYIATKHKNLMSSAFPKEPTYITCQRRTTTGEATHTNIHTHTRVLPLFSASSPYFRNTATKYISVSIHSLFRWRGDHGGKVRFLFPANYVEEVSNNFTPEANDQVGLKVWIRLTTMSSA